MISASIGAFQLTLVGLKNTAWYYYVVKMNLEIPKWQLCFLGKKANMECLPMWQLATGGRQ